MASTFHLKKAKDGQFHFNLLAGNGEIILSSELYKAKDSALNGIDSVKRNAPREGAFESKAASNDKHYFVLKASNGQVIGQSQMYASASGCRQGIESVRRNAPDAALRDDS
ncbi:YegP family protein [Pseudomonas benzenivorans]|uniref:YegP family protein n=1 Tax=Pseudomonas benzenivorans TaxID=556533 RepID=A0ABZ0PUX1_9PSED|nr:YegP family protein [Pseudomonas benzenivorans]WPC04952.1 YegP family protein [Pseudomonas benzenivorans]